MTLESANGQVVTGSVRLVHAAGMHARPAVKLTKLAKEISAHAVSHSRVRCSRMDS